MTEISKMSENPKNVRSETKAAKRLNINDSIHGKGFKHTQEDRAETAENSKYLLFGFKDTLKSKNHHCTRKLTNRTYAWNVLLAL